MYEYTYNLLMCIFFHTFQLLAIVTNDTFRAVHIDAFLVFSAACDTFRAFTVLQYSTVLHGCRLYSVTWWRNNQTFYQYGPSLPQRKMTYHNTPLNVDVSNAYIYVYPQWKILGEYWGGISKNYSVIGRNYILRLYYDQHRVYLYNCLLRCAKCLLDEQYIGFMVRFFQTFSSLENLFHFKNLYGIEKFQLQGAAT